MDTPRPEIRLYEAMMEYPRNSRAGESVSSLHAECLRLASEIHEFVYTGRDRFEFDYLILSFGVIHKKKNDDKR
jgi:hypothetical protein